MSIFSSILEKLGFAKPEETAAAAVASRATGVSASVSAKIARADEPAKPAATVHSAASAQPAAAPRPAAVPVVDVMSKLENLAGKNSGLDWKVSIVDLLKLLGIDSSLQARKDLAQELGCPADLMGGDHSKMNIWLHKTVLQMIAENGGNIPANLLD